MRTRRSPMDVLAIVSIAVALVGILVLPLMEKEGGAGSVPGAVVIGQGPSCADCSADAPEGVLLFLETAAVALALVAALVFSFVGARWARVARIAATGVAAIPLFRMPGTVADSIRFADVRWGHTVALLATMLALIASVLAAVITPSRSEA